MTVSRIWLWLFGTYAAATAVHVGYCVAHEPFSFDAWNVAWDTDGEAFSLGGLFRYWGYEYTHSNPRIGQPFAYCAYKLTGFAEVATPLVFLAVSLAITVLAVGRWPWRRAGDLALWAIAIGCCWFALPELGRNMFSRAYATNYVYTAAIQLWFLVVLRMGRQDCSRRAAIACGVLGLAAGLCNEHTGPALLALVGGYAWWRRRRGLPALLTWAGLAGFAVGFLVIFFAPGQAERYDSLATKTGLVTRLLQRGFITNLGIVGDYLRFAAPLLALVAIVLVARADEDGRRRALRAIAIALAFGGIVAVTLFVSPRLGSRFFILPMALLLGATLALVEMIPQRLPLMVLAVAASIYAAARTVPLYARVARESAARQELLGGAPRGSAVVADAFAQVEESWWFIGDDFRTAHQRTAVARYLGLSRIGFRGYDPDAPLGSTGVQIVAPGPLDLAGVKPMDIAAIQAAIREQVAQGAVTVVAEGVTLPRPKLLLARWSDGRFEAYAGAISRPGVTIEREVALPPELRDMQTYVVQIGSETRALDASRRYTPWRTGVYWVLACDASVCWLVAAGRNHAA